MKGRGGGRGGGGGGEGAEEKKHNEHPLSATDNHLRRTTCSHVNNVDMDRDTQ